MMSPLTRLKSRFPNWRDWELNPIVIKELRQAVRNWSVTGMLLLFLVVLFITSLFFLVDNSFDVSENMHLGGSMFTAFVVILAVASGLFIPVYVGVRVAAERQDNNPDLLYVSTLSPVSIVLGKFLCGAYMAVLFFSACMPFMAFTNLMRGVDLPTVFLILGFLFLVVCAANMVAIFLACLPVSRALKFLFLLYILFQSIAIISSLVGTSIIMMRSGVGTLAITGKFWIAAATWVGLGVALVGLLFVLSVALISPPSANRALPARIYLTGIWLLSGLIAFGWVEKTGDANRFLDWSSLAYVILVLALLVCVSNHDQLSHRVRRKIPRAFWKRAFAFLFYNGAAGGLTWVALLFAGTFIAVWATVHSFHASTSPQKLGLTYISTTAYVFAYALSALFLHRKFFPHRTTKTVGILSILLAAAWAILPSVALFFVNRLSWKSVEGLQLGNVFNVAFVRDQDKVVYHLVFALAWLLIVLLLNAGWFVRQLKQFRPTPPINEDDAAVCGG